MSIGTMISIFLNVIALCIIFMQWYSSHKAKKELRTILDTIYPHATMISSRFPNIEKAAGVQLATGLSTIGTDAFAIANHIDQFRRNHFKEEPPSNAT